MPRLALAVAALIAALTFTTASAHAATPLDTAAAQVARDARHYHGSRDNRIAWAAFHYVNRTIRSERGTRIPITQWSGSLDDAIRLRAGACGTATSVALEIADRLGVKARPVQFYYTETDGSIGSHIMAEFYVDGGWRLYDLLFHTVYRSPATGRLLSARQVTAMPYASAMHRKQEFPDAGRDLFIRGASPWKVPHNPYRYLADPRSEMTVTDHGTVTMPRTADGFAPQSNRPGFIGQTKTFGERRSDIKQRLVGTFGGQITVHLTSGCGNGRLVARSRVVGAAPITAATTSVTLPASGSSVVLSIEGGCYVVVQSVDA